MRGSPALTALLFASVACGAPSSEAPDAAGGADALGGAPAAGAPTACASIDPANAWASWPMPNPVNSGLPNAMSYTVSATGNQVTDDVTALIWQRHVDAGAFTWADARQHCACVLIDGIAGWRLPSRIELASLADWTVVHPSIDSAAFPDTPSEAFWSASVLENGDPDLAWHIDFDSSHTSYTDKGYTHRVRCVRGGAASSGDRYAITDGNVLDNRTKLTWQQDIGDDTYSWSDAATHCSGLPGAAWRLPSIGELQTLVDETTNPAVTASAFPMTPSEYFWSSSVVADDPTRAWDTFFANGSTYSFATTMQRYVRCVR